MTLPFKDFVAAAKAPGRCLETPKIWIPLGRGADHGYSEAIYSEIWKEMALNFTEIAASS